MSNPYPKTDSLRELQDYIWQMNVDRGFSEEGPSHKMLLLLEEVGELAKALRKTVGMKFSETTEQTVVSEELADVQIVILGLASMIGVDMVDAVREKEMKNSTRNWR